MALVLTAVPPQSPPTRVFPGRAVLAVARLLRERSEVRSTLREGHRHQQPSWPPLL